MAIKKSEHLERAFELYNEGKIDADTYDAILMNVEEFTYEEED